MTDLTTVDGRPVQGGAALPVFFINGGFMPLDLISNVQGAILYRSASGWVALLPGTALKVLTTNGPAADPTWESVTDAMLAEVATATFKGRATTGTGAVETLTAAQATALLAEFVPDNGIAVGLKGLVPAPGIGDLTAGKVLGVDGWVVPGSGPGWLFSQAIPVTAQWELAPSVKYPAPSRSPQASHDLQTPTHPGSHHGRRT